MSLEIQRKVVQGVPVVELTGVADYGVCREVRSQFDAARKEAEKGLVADLSGVTYLDSSALGVLLSLNREYGGEWLVLVLVTNEAVESILTVTRLNSAFRTVDTQEEALDYIARLAGPH